MTINWHLRSWRSRLMRLFFAMDNQYIGTKWTIKHVTWLEKLELDPIYLETLNEYIASYEEQGAKIGRYDKRVDELATEARNQENTKRLGCFLGIRTHSTVSDCGNRRL